MSAFFEDRRDAGRALAGALSSYPGLSGAIVLALPRGGVPVAYEVARALHLPLDIFIVRKLGVPGEEELAMGALASGGTVVLNHLIVRQYGITQPMLDASIEREREEIGRRELAYRSGRAPLAVEGKTVLLIDDGLATGSTMMAAVRALRTRAERILVAIPVAAESACHALANEVNQIVCLITPKTFFAVGDFYRDFRQTTDEEVRDLLERSRDETASAA